MCLSLAQAHRSKNQLFFTKNMHQEMQRKVKSRAVVALPTACHWGNKQMEDEGQQSPNSLLHVLMQQTGHARGFPEGTRHHTDTAASSAAPSVTLETPPLSCFNRGLDSSGSKASSDKAVGLLSDRSILPQNQKDGHVVHRRGQMPGAKVHTSLGLV